MLRNMPYIFVSYIEIHHDETCFVDGLASLGIWIVLLPLFHCNLLSLSTLLLSILYKEPTRCNFGSIVY